MLTLRLTEAERLLINDALRCYGNHCQRVAEEVGGRAEKLKRLYMERASKCYSIILNKTCADPE